jgi:hypothetical protein
MTIAPQILLCFVVVRKSLSSYALKWHGRVYSDAHHIARQEQLYRNIVEVDHLSAKA